MKVRIFVLFIPLVCFVLVCSSKSANEFEEQTEQPTRWKLVWSDEFDGTEIDQSKWDFQIGDGTTYGLPAGWGNNELQYYTDRSENVKVENGHLVITANAESYGGYNYTSTRMRTINKGDWTYGRFEIRAKLPSGRGTWPAIWMLPTVWNYGNGSWPDNGEIDVMEHVGFEPEIVHATIHSGAYNWIKNTQQTAMINISDAETEFHNYALEWTSEKVEAFVDSTKYFTFQNDGAGWQTWPFNKDFHLILNIAVGGNWGGLHGVDDSVFPQRMEGDYIRVYEQQVISKQ